MGFGGLPSWSSSYNSMLPKQQAWVRLLVWELKSYMVWVWPQKKIFLINFFPIKNVFCWSVVDLQVCANFRCAVQWLHRTYNLSHVLVHHGSSQDAECGSLSWTLRPPGGSDLKAPACNAGDPAGLVVGHSVCTSLHLPSQTPSPCLPQPLPLGNHKSLLYVWEPVCFVHKFT